MSIMYEGVGGLSLPVDTKQTQWDYTIAQAEVDIGSSLALHAASLMYLCCS